MNIIQDYKLQRTHNFNIKINFTVLFFITLFLMNDTARSFISPEFSWINVSFFSVFVIFYAISIKKGRIHFPSFLLILLFGMLAILNAFLLGKNTTYITMTITNLLGPLFLLSIKITKEQALKTLKTFAKIFNALIIILTVLGIYDFLTNSSFQLFLAKTAFKNSPLGELIFLENSWGIYRYYSPLGHPLQNAKYYLIFFITNSILAKYDQSRPSNLIISGITIIGLLLSASKTALLIGLFLIVFFGGIKRKKIVYLFTVFVLLIIFINTSLFQENLKVRFVEGYQTGDITSGRQDLLDNLINSEIEAPEFLLGGGADYSRKIATSLNTRIKNFEYPIIMLAYDYGIVGTLIIYILIAAIPVIKLIKSKDYYLLIMYLALLLMINTNNGIANLGSDSLAQMCFLILIITSISKPLEYSQ